MYVISPARIKEINIPIVTAINGLGFIKLLMNLFMLSPC